MSYFSDRERGAMPQAITQVTPTAWRGIATVIQGRLDNRSFGARFPEMCPDGAGACGVDQKAFWDALRAEIPTLDSEYPGFPLAEGMPPPLHNLMDMIEFCWRSVSRVEERGYHSFFKHQHIAFDVGTGRAEFQDDINRIFRRNELAFVLTERGEIERLVPAEIGAALHRAQFRTGDTELDAMLDAARQKFLDLDERVRREALEKLWDAWERLKRLDGKDKKTGIAGLVDQAAGAMSRKLRAVLDEEARALTDMGNSFQIRHSETTQERLQSGDHVDYLFCRLFSLLYLLLRASGRLG